MLVASDDKGKKQEDKQAFNGEADAKAARGQEQAEAKAAAGNKPAQVAALAADAGKSALSPQQISRSLQTELRRVGCQTAAVSDEWTAASRRSLELFNKHANTTFDTKLASLDALDAVKGTPSRI